MIFVMNVESWTEACWWSSKGNINEEGVILCERAKVSVSSRSYGDSSRMSCLAQCYFTDLPLASKWSRRRHFFSKPGVDCHCYFVSLILRRGVLSVTRGRNEVWISSGKVEADPSTSWYEAAKANSSKPIQNTTENRMSSPNAEKQRRRFTRRFSMARP